MIGVWMFIGSWFLSGLVSVIYVAWLSKELKVSDLGWFLVGILLGPVVLIGTIIDEHKDTVLWRRKP